MAPKVFTSERFHSKSAKEIINNYMRNMHIARQKLINITKKIKQGSVFNFKEDSKEWSH